MTTTIEVKELEDMRKKIDLLTKELKELKKKEKDGFEPLDTDPFLTEVYN
ncbi:hypothetical protein [Bacillus alkalicellulosilyticus]|nr:hypothetical protein [Bacillus alkalicellulosilyticus]